MSDENGRVEYIREDFQDLKREMKEGFNDISEKLDQARRDRLSEKQEIYDHCSNKRSVLTKKIEASENNITSLDKKIDVVAFTSGGIGFILGILAKEYFPLIF